MKKVLLLTLFFGSLLLYSCDDTYGDIYGDVDEDSKPSWLGGSIYSELKDGGQLDGTFTTYLRLIDDLGYAETLNRTGSKTIFPANDEAFQRFFKNNEWGASSYDDLTYAQKKLLLYSSMLDNALLTNMLANVESTASTTGMSEGMALKHPSNISVIDTITKIMPAEMPKNNAYWDTFRESGQPIWAVLDNTTPPIVHFTREQMVNNGISTSGDRSDFAIITGEVYNDSEKPVYIYDNKIIKKDITCLNGYIHQVQDVLVQPGNMAQVIGKDKDLQFFNHILDYFKVAYPDNNTTTSYNSWVSQNPETAAANGYTQHDNIYKVRYLSVISQGADGNTDPNGTAKPTNEVLNYDPGWNEYYPNSNRSTADIAKITDMGAMFVPTDDALWGYFSTKGAFIINEYGKKPNTRENLLENLDSVHKANPVILTSFVNNIEKTSFTATVPSKFPEIINDASELLNMHVDSLVVRNDGKYDIKIANNGIVYKIHGVLAPDRYRSVLGPVCTYRDMKVMDWAVEEKLNSYLGIDFQYYLLAMKAKYAFFVPDDDAFGAQDIYYLDPASINWETNKAQVLHFWYDNTDRNLRSQQYLGARAYTIDLKTGEITTNQSDLSFNSSQAQIKSALADILDHHTVVLENSDMENGDPITHGNKYYKTKGGCGILVEKAGTDWTVKGGSQVDGLLPASDVKLPASKVEVAELEDNGYAYRIDHVIQPTIRSVSQVLANEERFSEFYKMCTGFANAELMYWIGYSDDYSKDPFGVSDQQRKLIFTNDYSFNTVMNRSLAKEGNVKMFNTFNYTLYAPDNDAMAKAYAAGLPSWDDIYDMFEKAREASNKEHCPEPYASVLKQKVERMNEFCKYHFQYISLYADEYIPASDGGNTRYQSMYAPVNQPLKENQVSCSGGLLTVTDGGGQAHTVNANDGTKLSNIMARDYWLNKSPGEGNNSILTSSFCVIHEITEPLYFDSTLKYNAAWEADDFTADDLLNAL
jgi:uncharacterized surface protein with fasciclin (FAS1) repeats